MACICYNKTVTQFITVILLKFKCMRSIINISLPEELVVQIEKMIKKGGYSTKSEFLRDLIRERIEGEQVLVELRKSQEEIRQGKGKVLRSLKDLR